MPETTMPKTVDFRHVMYFANGNNLDACIVSGDRVYSVCDYGVIILEPFDNHTKMKKILIPWQWVVEFGWFGNDSIQQRIIKP